MIALIQTAISKHKPPDVVWFAATLTLCVLLGYGLHAAEHHYLHEHPAVDNHHQHLLGCPPQEHEIPAAGTIS